MPLGLMPESRYDEVREVINPGEVLLLYSDGITEQHNDSGEMFGFDRTRSWSPRPHRVRHSLTPASPS